MGAVDRELASLDMHDCTPEEERARAALARAASSDLGPLAFMACRMRVVCG